MQQSSLQIRACQPQGRNVPAEQCRCCPRWCPRRRRGYGIELDPRYCDVIVRRMASAANIEAIQATTGKPFAEIERERAAGAAVDHQPGREACAVEEVA